MNFLRRYDNRRGATRCGTEAAHRTRAAQMRSAHDNARTADDASSRRRRADHLRCCDKIKRVGVAREVVSIRAQLNTHACIGVQRTGVNQALEWWRDALDKSGREPQRN